MRIVKYFVLFFACCGMAAGLTDLQRSYLRERVRLVGRDTVSVPGAVVNHFRQGSRSWSTTNQLTRANVVTVEQLSKLSLIRALKARERWAKAKALIREAGLEDEWIACRWISVADPAFIAGTNQAVRTGLATDQELQEVIRAAADWEGR